MAGNVFGTLLRIATFGESHGRAVGVIVDGVPPGIPLTEADVQKDMDRRRPGQSSVTTPRRETDEVSILSGVFEGRTTGVPVAMMVWNRDPNPAAYVPIKDKFRPGHADFTYHMKYGLRDWRGSGRASGRETAARVAAGAVARKILEREGVRVTAYALEIGGVRASTVDLSVIEKNIVRSPDLSVADEMIARIEAAREAEDSIGGLVEAVVSNCPPGLGDPVFDKLEARIAGALMSVGAVRGVEVGVGFGCARQRGSEYNDEFEQVEGQVRTTTNNAGGILGGIATGAPIIVRAAVRPPASISRSQQTVTVSGAPATIATHGRHDPCIVPRIVPVIEAMLALTLADALLLQSAYAPWRNGTALASGPGNGQG